jgi:hypothetical protein
VSECNFHEDAVEFRVETASVEIGKCPLCGEDTEWSYRREPAPDALREAAREVVRQADDGYGIGPFALDDLRAALAVKP